jgi:hypothetical protein
MAYILIAGNRHEEKEDENDYGDCLKLKLTVASEFIQDPAEEAEEDTKEDLGHTRKGEKLRFYSRGCP